MNVHVLKGQQDTEEVQRFHEIADAAAILCNKQGVYRQAKVFRRGAEIYAGHGSGFIRLFGNGGTSQPHTKHIGLDLGSLKFAEDRLGRLLLEA